MNLRSRKPRSALIWQVRDARSRKLEEKQQAVSAIKNTSVALAAKRSEDRQAKREEVRTLIGQFARPNRAVREA